jgi:hypothetical protein
MNSANKLIERTKKDSPLIRALKNMEVKHAKKYEFCNDHKSV